jgi:osmoprotectant transport system permease protein
MSPAVADPWIQWSWVGANSDRIVSAVREHITLTAIAVSIGLAIALPLGVAASQFRRVEAPVLAVSGTLYAIPSLALFALLIPWTGLSRTTAEIGLVGYTLLILVRNTITGIEGVPPDIREAATGMGMTASRRLLRVELPLAAPAIFAGIRIATVTTVGLVTVTALIGQGGLGGLILEGFNQYFRTKVVVGAALSVVLAVVADLGLAGLQRALLPWARGRRG